MILSKVFTKKLTIGLSVITTLISIVGGIWAFDSHYASAKRVDFVETTTKDNIEKLEITIAGALQNQQYKSDVRYYQIMDDKLRDDIYQLRKQIERDPNNELLKRDYEDLQNRRKDVQKKMEESIQKIRVN